jgi:hypothetical protein
MQLVARRDDDSIDWQAAAVWVAILISMCAFWAGVGWLVSEAVADAGQPHCSTPAVIVGNGYATSSIECNS